MGTMIEKERGNQNHSKTSELPKSSYCSKQSEACSFECSFSASKIPVSDEMIHPDYFLPRFVR